MLRHPVADELRELTQNGSLFVVRNMGLGRRAPKMREIRSDTKGVAEAVLQLCARKALAGPPVTESVYRAEWSSKRTVASLMEETYLRVLYAVNERIRRADGETFEPYVPLEHEGEREQQGESSEGSEVGEAAEAQVRLAYLLENADELVEEYGREAYEEALEQAFRAANNK